MRWTAVVNPTAGRGRTRKLLPRLVDALAGTDLDVDVRVSEDLDDAIRIARRAFDDGRGVVACGGDGTVNALAGVAADHGGVLGIVPTGAGNDFARHLGLDRRHWLDAVALLETGQIGAVDLGRAELAGSPDATDDHRPLVHVRRERRLRRRRPTAGPTACNGRAARRSTCSRCCARWRRTGRTGSG